MGDYRAVRGRPRKTPADLSPSDRTVLWRHQLHQGGGKTLQVHLGAMSWDALQQLAPKGERGPFIEGLIIEALRALEAAAIRARHNPED